MSVAIDPLMKVRLVCEGSYMVDFQKTGLDIEQVETIHTVALGFLNTIISDSLTAIAWGFTLTSDNYKRFNRVRNRQRDL
jgi:hypothetical protein